MATFAVGFDGEWQEEFDSEEVALEWAEAVADTGRTVFVIRKRFMRAHRLVAVFPEDRAEYWTEVWSKRVVRDWAAQNLPPVGGEF